jgi:hypothetical protein
LGILEVLPMSSGTKILRKFSYNQLFKGSWEIWNNRRRFADWIFDELEFRDLDDWYGISRGEIVEKGGCSMIYEYYRGSLYHAMKDLYPSNTF